MTKKTTKTTKPTICPSELRMQFSPLAEAMLIRIFERSIEALQSGVACDSADLGIICAHVFSLAEQVDGGITDDFLLGLTGDATNQALKNFIQQGDAFPWNEVCSHRT